MSSYIEITFNPLLKEQSDLLVALLADSGFESFEEAEKELKAFIKKENYNEEVVSQLSQEYGIPFTKKEIEQQNWNQLWESNFHPVIVDDFVAVRAGFHDPVKNVQHEIIITPKMSFGTGHHATTNMMMRQMREINFKGKTVLDFGTGTGVLAILAEKLGASSVTAIDNDEWSIENASENFVKNDCIKINLKKADSIPHDQTFDIILANITKNIILENFPFLNQQLNKSGILLLSGLLENDENEIITESTGFSFIPGAKLKSGNWLCLRFLR